MADTSLMYLDPTLGKNQTRKLRYTYSITGAKTISEALPPYNVLYSFDAIASQATIDSFLGGAVNQFLLAAFDATAMGTDAVAFLVRLGGQASKLVSAKCYTLVAATGAVGLTWELPVVAAGLTASSLTTQCALGANGDLAARFVLTGLDALTSGSLVVEFEWISK